MKRVIRKCTFETNSSSTHSLTIVALEKFKKWKRNELFLKQYEGTFYTKDEVIEEIQKNIPSFNWDKSKKKGKLNNILSEYDFFTCESYFDYYAYELETFKEQYKTENGEDIVAFGYYGYDG